VCLCGAVLAASGPRLVIVRTYNTYGVSTNDVRSAARTLSLLLASVGIETRWRNCRIVGRPPAPDVDPCTDPLAPHELIVRLVAVGAAARGGETTVLGDAFIDPLLQRGSLATVYADRVDDLSRALRVDRGVMIGRAVTHEVAHLLLGSRLHSTIGVMRDTWPVRASRMDRGDEWRFTPEEGLELRSKLDARLK
jgi:hypothetical protein